MDFFMEYESEFQNIIDNADICMMEAVTNFMESFGELNYFSEKSSDTLFVKLKKFFADLIAGFQNFKSSITIEVNKKLRDKEFQFKLRSLYDDAKNKKENGVKKIEIKDIWYYSRTYIDGVEELKTYAKKFANMKYRYTKDIDNDIVKFNNILKSLEDDLKEASEKTIKVTPDKLMKFIEDEISGRSDVIKTLNETITLFEHMKDDCNLIETRRDILGPDIIPKHVGFIRRMCTSISSFIKRHVVKFISTVVLIIG